MYDRLTQERQDLWINYGVCRAKQKSNGGRGYIDGCGTQRLNRGRPEPATFTAAAAVVRYVTRTNDEHAQALRIISQFHQDSLAADPLITPEKTTNAENIQICSPF